VASDGAKEPELSALDHDWVWDDLGHLRARRVRSSQILLSTGLRKSGPVSITVSQLHLDDPYPFIELLAKDEETGRGATIPLRADMFDEIGSLIRLVGGRPCQAGHSPLPGSWGYVQFAFLVP
jgi:hypothetical protein